MCWTLGWVKWALCATIELRKDDFLFCLDFVKSCWTYSLAWLPREFVDHKKNNLSIHLHYYYYYCYYWYYDDNEVWQWQWQWQWQWWWVKKMNVCTWELVRVLNTAATSVIFFAVVTTLTISAPVDWILATNDPSSSRDGVSSKLWSETMILQSLWLRSRPSTNREAT